MIKRFFYVLGWFMFGPWMLATFIFAPVVYILTGKTWDNSRDAYLTLMERVE